MDGYWSHTVWIGSEKFPLLSRKLCREHNAGELIAVGESWWEIAESISVGEAWNLMETRRMKKKNAVVGKLMYNIATGNITFMENWWETAGYKNYQSPIIVVESWWKTVCHIFRYSQFQWWGKLMENSYIQNSPLLASVWGNSVKTRFAE